MFPKKKNSKKSTAVKSARLIKKNKLSLTKEKPALPAIAKAAAGKRTKRVLKKKIARKKTANKKKPIKKITPRQSSSATKISPRSTKDNWELKIFEFTEDDQELELNHSPEELAVETLEPAAATTSAPPVNPPAKQSTEVLIKVNHAQRQPSSVYRPSVLDLKNLSGKTQIKPESYDLSFLAKFEDSPQTTFYQIFSWPEDTAAQDNSLIRKLRLFLNLTAIAWLLYLSLLAYQLLQPVSQGLFKIISFIARSFAEHIATIGSSLKLFFLVLTGQAKFSPDNFLYPERLSVQPNIFALVRPVATRTVGFNSLAFKSAGLFILIALVIALPIKGLALLDEVSVEKQKVLGVSETAYSTLQLALEDIKNYSWISASSRFAESHEQFSELAIEFADLNSGWKKFLLLLPVVKTKIHTAESLVAIGVDLSRLGEELSQLLYLLQTSDDSVTVTQKISVIRKSIDNIQVIEDRINTSFSQVSINALPEDRRAEVLGLKNTLPKLFSSLDQVDELLGFAYQVLGGDKQQKYLLIFQNSDEIRPTGGFMGSLSTVDIYQGKVMSMATPTGGPYDWQGWLTEKTIAPRPLWIVNPVWQFQDANWFYNYPSTVEKVLKFYHQTEPAVVDGVIAVNSYVLPQILEIVGPVELPDYNKVLTPENVLLEIQKAVELEYDRLENQPKKIIGDLLAVIVQRLAAGEKGNLMTFLELTNQSLLEREVQMYFIDPSLQAKVKEWGWNGQAVETSGDYLAVINTNIAGAKTDKFMLLEMHLSSEINLAGEIINTLTITRTNDGIPGDIFYGHNNVNYLRVYVPLGSQLLSAAGDFEPPADEFFELPDPEAIIDQTLQKHVTNSFYDEELGIRITEEFGKTAFAGWLQTNLAEVNTVTFVYKLPFTVRNINTKTDNSLVNEFNRFLQYLGIDIEAGNKNWHTFYWQKQSGQRNTTATYTLSYPPEWSVDYTSLPGYKQRNSINYQMPLTQDFNNGVLFGIE